MVFKSIKNRVQENGILEKRGKAVKGKDPFRTPAS